MSNIPPTVGRVVWFNPGMGDRPDVRFAAHVARVNEDGTVNLMVINESGHPSSFMDVELVQDGAPCGPGQCEWMPYQKGQAAKTDTLEPRMVELEARIKQLEALREIQVEEPTGDTGDVGEGVGSAGGARRRK